ncbi:MAG: histidine kinase, partial [Chitinophagaceae bacterium]
MRINWKQHELLLLVGLGTFFLAKTLLDLSYTGQFKFSLNFPFGLFILLFTLANNLVIPGIRKQKISTPVAIVITFGAWALIAFLVAFQILYDPASNDSGITDVRKLASNVGAITATVSLVIVSAYLYFRESMIRSLEKPGKRNEFRIMLTNRITLTAAIYLLGLSLPFIFNLRIADSVAILYILVILPSLIMIFVNIHRMGMIGLKKEVTIQTAWRFLLIVPVVICTLMTVTFIVMSQHIITYIFWIFLFMLLIINPISWFVFKQMFKSFSELHQLKVDLGNTSANLQFLRTQINPHFLFNALNTIYGTAIQENAPRTSEAAQKLGDMMRFMLHENTLDHIPLEREIQYLNNYISLQTLRTAGSDKIRIETQIEDNYHIHQV